MRKTFIIFGCLFAFCIVSVTIPIIMYYNTQRLQRDTNIHSAVNSVYGETYGETEDGRVLMSEANVYYFLKAMTRYGMRYRFVTPDVSGMPQVRITFFDGAEFIIADAGEDKDGADVAYIVYTYDGRTLSYSLSGYSTYVRAYRCASPGGYSGENVYAA